MHVRRLCIDHRGFMLAELTGILDSAEFCRVAPIHRVGQIRNRAVVNREHRTRADALDEIDRLTDFGPGRGKWECKYIDSGRRVLVGVAGMKERRFAGGRDDDANIVDAGELRRDFGVGGTDTPERHVTDADFVAVSICQPSADLKHGCRLRVRQKNGVGVGLEQLRETVGIDMIAMLMSDDNRRKSGERERVIAAEGAGIDEDALVGGFHQDGRVGKSSDLHKSIMQPPHKYAQS